MTSLDDPAFRLPFDRALQGDAPATSPAVSASRQIDACLADAVLSAGP